MPMRFKKESGEVMIESTIVMVITLLMLVWILGVGFLYYQKYAVRIATNDVAKKIAASYDAPSSDIIMGYISASDLDKKTVYSSDEMTEINRLRTESYVNYIIEKANLYGTVDDVVVKLDYQKDALGRSHIKVTTECTFDTPFGEGLELFGISGKQTYVVTAYADSTSLTDYISAVSVADALTNGSVVKMPGFVDSTIKMIESFMEMCKQFSE